MSHLLPRNLGVLLRTEAPLLDARLVLGVQLVEVEVQVACRAHQLHRHVHQAKAEGAGPERARHQLAPRLASSAAARSSPCSGSSCAARSMSLPALFRLISA